MSSIESVLEKILVKEKGYRFYSFANNSGKRWIIPVQNMKVAMNLYQPGWRTGKILKALFPYLYWLKPVQYKIGAEKINCRLNDRITDIIKSIFNIQNFEFSIFCGAPVANQKVILQISSGKKLLGYCKISDSPIVIKSFDSEYSLLTLLFKKGIKTVPMPLYNDWIDDKIKMYVQSTNKSLVSYVSHNWSNLEEDFLNDIYSKTKEEIRFEQSDFYFDIKFLKDNISVLSFLKCNIINETIEDIIKYYKDKNVFFSFFHGDFTPWNCYVEKNKLYAFDFEYSKLSYPPFLDCFHYFVLSFAYEKHMTKEEILEYYNKSSLFCNLFDNRNFAFKCYLVTVIALYIRRENGVFSDDIKNIMKLWIYLLEHIDNK